MYQVLLFFNRPDLLIRAARHYEGAEQILRRQAVFTAKKVLNHYMSLSVLFFLSYGQPTQLRSARQSYFICLIKSLPTDGKIRITVTLF